MATTKEQQWQLELYDAKSEGELKAFLSTVGNELDREGGGEPAAFYWGCGLVRLLDSKLGTTNDPISKNPLEEASRAFRAARAMDRRGLPLMALPLAKHCVRLRVVAARGYNASALEAREELERIRVDNTYFDQSSAIAMKDDVEQLEQFVNSIPEDPTLRSARLRLLLLLSQLAENLGQRPVAERSARKALQLAREGEERMPVLARAWSLLHTPADPMNPVLQELLELLPASGSQLPPDRQITTSFTWVANSALAEGQFDQAWALTQRALENCTIGTAAIAEVAPAARLALLCAAASTKRAKHSEARAIYAALRERITALLGERHEFAYRAARGEGESWLVEGDVKNAVPLLGYAYSVLQASFDWHKNHQASLTQLGQALDGAKAQLIPSVRDGELNAALQPLSAAKAYSPSIRLLIEHANEGAWVAALEALVQACKLDPPERRGVFRAAARVLFARAPASDAVGRARKDLQIYL